MKKAVSLLCSLVLLLSLLAATGMSLPVSAATSGTCGNSLKWTLSDDGVLVISGTGKMTDWTDIQVPWYSSRTSVKAVVIGDGVTSIGNYAFWDCDSLTSVTIPDSVTSIGEYAFGYCRNLASVSIPDSVTSVGDWAFYVCDSLTSVMIPDSVTIIGWHAFMDCMGLRDVYITGLEAWCKIVFCSYASNPLRYANNLYLNGELVTDLAIPDGVTSIGYSAFCGCTSLTTVTIPDSVTNIGNDAFSECTNLNSLRIGDGVTSIGDFAFEGCDSLTSVTIGDSVTSIGDSAFYDCDSLKKVYYTGSESDLLAVSIGSYNESLFYAAICYEVSAFSDDWVYKIEGDCATVVGYVGGNDSLLIPTEIDGYTVVSVGRYAFLDCMSLQSVTIPDSVTGIGDGAFEGCDSLTDVYYGGSESDWNTVAIGDYNSPLTSATIHFGKEDVVSGDADGDGVITSSDVRLALTFVVDCATFTDEQVALCDLNGDGVVRSNDIRLMLKMLV